MKILGWLYFAIVQAIALLAMAIGWILLIPFAAFKLWKVETSADYPPREQWLGGKLMFIWGNLEDGVIGAPFYRQKHTDDRLCAYLWSAWRNSANNLRFVFRWKGGPFKRWTFGRWYIQCGWYPNGFAVFSAGSIEPELPNV